MSSAALPTERTAAAMTAVGDPAMVTTERLCAVSSDQSRRRTSSACMDETIWLTLFTSVPSEKLGTHSMMASGFMVTDCCLPLDARFAALRYYSFWRRLFVQDEIGITSTRC